MTEKDIFGFEVPPYLKRIAAEQRFEDGDPQAVDACVLACHEDGEPIPDWAVEELAKRSRIKLGLEEPPPRKPGRHSNPDFAYDEKLNIKALCCAVLGARKHGVGKEASYQKAHELLQMVMGIDRYNDPESIKTVFQRHESEYRESEEAIERFEAMCHLFDKNLLDEYIADNKMNKRDIV